MSNLFYNDIWHLAQQDAESLAALDFDRQNLDFRTLVADSAIVDQKSFIQSTTYEFYIKYICIANKLEEAYDKMVHPQKRLSVRKLLDSCLGRVIELKHDLVNIDMMEFSYNDIVIDSLNLTPMDTELRIPRYILRERRQEVQFRKSAMDEILIKLGWIEENEMEEKLTEIEAIRIIQTHERARQGRLRAHFMKEIRMLKEKGKSEVVRDRNDSGLLAAMRIQKMWRGHAARRKTRRRKLEEMVLIGMIPPTPVQNMKAKYEAG